MLNSVAIIGRAVDAPEIKKSGEKEYATFAVAVDTGKEETSFFNCIAPESVVKALGYINKGDRLGITGYLRQRKWKTKEGKNASEVQIVVSLIDFIEKKPVEEKTTEETPF